MRSYDYPHLQLHIHSDMEGLTQVTGGGNIPPYLLMPCMDTALEMLVSEEAKTELKEQELKLQQILQDETTIKNALFPIEEKNTNV